MKAGHFKDPHILPHGAALLDMYFRINRKRGIDYSLSLAARDILHGVSKIALENVSVYTTCSGVRFPYTHVSLREIINVLKHPEDVNISSQIQIPPNHNSKINQIQENRKPRSKYEFIFPPIPWNTKQGSWFEYSEFPVRNMLRKIPQAVVDYNLGEYIFDYRIYTIGYPTHELGLVTKEYRRELEDGKFAGLSRPSFELVSEIIARMPNNGASVTLSGISLGSAVAAEIGSMLQSKKLVRPLTRLKSKLSCADVAASNEKETDSFAPFATIAMYLPAILNETRQPMWSRKVRLAFGLAIEAICRLTTNPTFRELLARRPGFENTARASLLHRSLAVNLDRDQEALKAECLRIYRELAVEGVQEPKGRIMALQIIGLHDPLTNSRQNRKQLIKANKKKILINRPEEEKADAWITREKTIARHWLPGSRRVIIDMGHLVPFSRKSVIAIFDRAADALHKIQG